MSSSGVCRGWCCRQRRCSAAGRTRRGWCSPGHGTVYGRNRCHLPSRSACVIEITRETLETSVVVRLELEPTTNGGPIDTSDAALDHMLATLARYAGLNLAVTADGDLRHHVIEDVAISLGLALRDAVPATCQRYGHAVVPMDDALVEATLDAGGRVYYQGPLP